MHDDHQWLDKLIDIINNYQRPSELWKVVDIATYLKLSVSSVQSRVICRDDFPSPIYIPSVTLNGKGGKRWYADEVIEWAKRLA